MSEQDQILERVVRYVARIAGRGGAIPGVASADKPVIGFPAWLRDRMDEYVAVTAEKGAEIEQLQAAGRTALAYLEGCEGLAVDVPIGMLRAALDATATEGGDDCRLNPGDENFQVPVSPKDDAALTQALAATSDDKEKDDE